MATEYPVFVKTQAPIIGQTLFQLAAATNYPDLPFAARA
jgi:hypothetical protein